MPRKVLVVDDDPLMHKVLMHYLERNGYEMLRASNGREAVEVAVRELPALIILDVRMPEMSGPAALRRLKEIEATKAIPVIIVTVNADRTTHVETEASGAAAFLAKPFRPGELLQLMERFIAPQSNSEGPPNPEVS